MAARRGGAGSCPGARLRRSLDAGLSISMALSALAKAVPDWLLIWIALAAAAAWLINAKRAATALALVPLLRWGIVPFLAPVMRGAALVGGPARRRDCGAAVGASGNRPRIRPRCCSTRDRDVATARPRRPPFRPVSGIALARALAVAISCAVLYRGRQCRPSQIERPDMQEQSERRAIVEVIPAERLEVATAQEVGEAIANH